MRRTISSAPLRGIVFAVLLAPAFLYAAPSDFPRPAGLEPQIEFWKKVFAVYSENQAVFHDDLHLDKVLSVVELPPLPENGLAELATIKLRRQRVEREERRLAHLLERLEAAGGPAGLTSEERRIWDLYRDVVGPRKFRAARARLRVQTGLRERFRRGLEVSRGYLPRMEAIFRSEGLPNELTRLPLIESTFNLKAYSKKAAAGIWQFIPSSARIYKLRMNGVLDDRRDPLYATRAAARHLRDDYASLGSWPLAITAYNHGRAGIARAVRETGSMDLVTIIRNYRGRSFGFASRNFYAEFLAALEIDRHRDQHFRNLELEPALDFDEVVIGDYVRFTTLARAAGVGVEELHELNPAFHRTVVEGRLYVPRGHVLRVPSGGAGSFQRAYAKLGSGERFAGQRVYHAYHRVSRGQTLGSIARRYGTSVRALQALNGIRRANHVRVGLLLKVPSRGGAVEVARAPRKATRVASQRSAFVKHRVSRGQTLGKIARRYGTTVSAIRASNGLRRANYIRAGQILKIPN